MMLSSEDNTPTGLVVRQRLSLLDRLAASDVWLFLETATCGAVQRYFPSQFSKKANSDSEKNDVFAESYCWLFQPMQTRGKLVLNAQHLMFDSKHISFIIDLADIRSVQPTHRNWWRVSCDSLTLKYMDKGQEQEVTVSPKGFAEPNCAQWCDLINAAKLKRGITRVVDNLRASVVDVESNTGQTKV